MSSGTPTAPTRTAWLWAAVPLLVLAALGGLAVPVVHISLGKIIRRSLKKAHAGSPEKKN